MSPMGSGSSQVQESDESNPKIEDNTYKPDEVIQERWKIIHNIRNAVYRAYDFKLNKEVALKVAEIDSTCLRVEVKILRKLTKFKHFCKCFHYNSDNKMQFIVMDLQGPNLSQLRKRYGMFPLTTILRAGLQMLEAIQYLHEAGFVHRNIRPSNFIIGKTNKKMIYLIDFSRAKEWFLIDKPDKSTKREGPVSKYSSPEVHNGTPMGRRDDLWSLLYTLIGCRDVLPWSTDTEDEVILKKKEQKTDYLIDLHLTNHFIEFRDHISSLDVDDPPYYELLRSCFVKSLETFKITNETEFLWENHPKQIWKLFHTRSVQYPEPKLISSTLNDFHEQNNYDIGKLMKYLDQVTSVISRKKPDSSNKLSNKNTLLEVLSNASHGGMNKELKYFTALDTNSNSSPGGGKSVTVIYNNPNCKAPFYGQLFSPKFDFQQIKQSVSKILVYPVQANFSKSEDIPYLRLVEYEPHSLTNSREIQTSVIKPNATKNNSKNSQVSKRNTKQANASTIAVENQNGKKQQAPGNQSSKSNKKKIANPKASSSSFLCNSNRQDAANSSRTLKDCQKNKNDTSKNVTNLKRTKDNLKYLFSIPSNSSSTGVIKTQDKNKIPEASKGKRLPLNKSAKRSSSPSPSSNATSRKSNESQSHVRNIIDKTPVGKNIINNKPSSLSSKSVKNSTPKNSKQTTKSKTSHQVLITSSSRNRSNTRLSSKKPSFLANTANKHLVRKHSQKSVKKKNSNNKIKNKSKKSKPLRILSSSLTMLSLPDDKTHLVPPKPDIKQVYKPEFSVSLITIPENKSLQVLQDSQSDIDMFHEMMLTDRDIQVYRSLSAQFQQYVQNSPVQAVFLDPQNQYIFIQSSDMDQFRQMLPEMNYGLTHIPYDVSREGTSTQQSNQRNNKLRNIKKSSTKYKKKK